MLWTQATHKLPHVFLPKQAVIFLPKQAVIQAGNLKNQQLISHPSVNPKMKQLTNVPITTSMAQPDIRICHAEPQMQQTQH
jgi:hypothetical protein